MTNNGWHKPDGRRDLNECIPALYRLLDGGRYRLRRVTVIENETDCEINVEISFIDDKQAKERLNVREGVTIDRLPGGAISYEFIDMVELPLVHDAQE